MQRKNDASLPHFPFYTRLTVTTAITSMGSSQYQLFWQTIESKNIFDRTGFGYAGAKDLTLSFWVRSSVAGPFSGALENWSQNRAFVWEVDINNKDTWEYKTVHIPPCTDGIWQVNTTNGGAYFMFSLGTTIGGTPNSGWVNAQRLGSSTDIRRIGIQGCTVDITGCQLEIGRVATEFDHRTYGEELQSCMRYFYKWSSSIAYSNFDIGYATDANNVDVIYQLPVIMRANPTLTTSGTFRLVGYGPQTYNNISSISLHRSHPRSPYLRCATSGLASGLVGEFGDAGSNNATMSFDAEL